MTPPTDIIVPVRNALAAVTGLIPTLRAHTTSYRLIMVDDNSTEEVAAFCRQVCAEQPSALYLRTGKQRWFTRAVNLGLRLVRTDRVIVLNSDCVVDAGWLDEIYAVWDEAVAQGAKVGLVGSVLSGEEPRRWAEYRRGLQGNGADYVTGHCWCLSMAAISELSCRRGTPGIYLNENDPRCIHIYSDNDLCYGLQEMGYATIASFKSAVGHFGGCSWGHALGSIPGRLEVVNDSY